MNFLVLLSFLLIFSGCLTVKDVDYTFDRETGLFTVDYHDVGSEKQSDSGPDYQEEDWRSLKKALVKNDDYKPEVVAVKDKRLYKEGGALSGRAVYQVQCPKCFETTTDLLKMLYSDGRWEEINGEVFLILPGNIPLSSANGKLIKTEKNNMCIWPAGSKKFEFSLAYGKTGDSLLDRYVKEGGK